jgi:peptide/nickel transport system ATP-binding protein
VRDLKKYFDAEDSFLDRLLDLETPPVRAVDGVSFDIEPGETFGLVGESGCGKSTVGQTLLRLLEPTAGETYYKDENIYETSHSELDELRQDVQIVFQDPFSSLNPRLTVGEIVREPLDIHDIGTKEERRETAADMLERVGLSRDQFDRYPHEFSGGQRQRICIARALVLEPEFILLDEPVSALDVSVQAQVLNLLDDLQEEFGLTYLFIAHDLGVVRYICDRVAVMYLGQLVEVGPTDAIFENPQHPYTKALLESIPRADLKEKERVIEGVSGNVPSPRYPPAGCRFHTRCREIIQPPNVDLEQETWRNIVTFQNRLTSNRENLEEYVLEADSPSDQDVARQAEELRNTFGITDIGNRRAETAVDTAARLTVRGDYDDALGEFDETFNTICRMKDPDTVDVGQNHETACFLCHQNRPTVTELSDVPEVSSDD